MTEHMNIRKRVKGIDRKSTLNSILDDSMLDEKEQQMIKMHYIEGKSFDYIADILGYSQSGILKMHKRALKKIENLI